MSSKVWNSIKKNTIFFVSSHTATGSKKKNLIIALKWEAIQLKRRNTAVLKSYDNDHW